MAVNNTYNAFDGVREAKSNAFASGSGGHWTDIASTADLNRQLCKLYQFKPSGSKLVRNVSDELNFSLDVRNIACDNRLSEGELRFTVTYRLEIPLRFMREIRVTVPIDNVTQATLKPKY